MTGMSDNDRILLSRLVDGELGELERRSLEARLEREPALRAEFEELEGARSWFGQASAGAPAARPPASFAARVMDEVRRQPSPEMLAAACREAGAEIQTLARRLTLAALVLLGAAILLTAALWTSEDAAELQAEPNDIREVMGEIDEAIRTGAAERGAVRPDGTRSGGGD